MLVLCYYYEGVNMLVYHKNRAWQSGIVKSQNLITPSEYSVHTAKKEEVAIHDEEER
jgi:hypothetical protein